jgi:heme/copper-type cytochrome/quinol oxidase subunit 2
MISFKKITLLFFLISIKVALYSQCAMCKAVVESSDSNVEGINNGILYLMFIPYILIGTVGYLIYRHHKKNKQSEQA